MNIIYRIKSWFEPKIEVATTKAKVRFKNGVAFSTMIPANAGFDMRNKVDGFEYRNQDWEAVEEMRSALYNMGRQQAMDSVVYCGAGNVGVQGQLRGNPQSLMGGNLWGRW